MKILNYEYALKILTSQEKFHICLGLERIGAIMEILGNPQENLEVIHIAGTNGKGSVSAILNSILTEEGYKTGLFTSPHLIKYTERIKINNEDIPDEEFARLVDMVCELSKKHEIYLTEFEILTAAAFKYFSDNAVDICILETGLGGRYDSSNIIKTNLISVITSISLDHTERLGDTVEKIAYEKAGIIKENCSVVINRQNAGYEVISQTAKEKNAKIIDEEINIDLRFENGTNYAVIEGKKYKFGLLGLYQKENLMLALKVLKNSKGFHVSNETLKRGLEKVSWSCRMQYLKDKNLLLDGAHNPDGASRLRESLEFYFPDAKRIWIYGTLKNKDYGSVMQTLFKEGDVIYLYDFQHTNRADFEILAESVKFPVYPLKPGQLCDVMDSEGLKIIAGSLYMLGEILSSNKNF